MPGLTLALGSVGIGYLIDAKKSGYFPQRIAAPYIANGELRRLDAPQFDYPVYAVYQAEEAVAALMRPLLADLKRFSRAHA
ncbi:MAG: hypothetical protein R3C40_08940 [Parvularculaceae bacterium]